MFEQEEEKGPCRTKTGVECPFSCAPPLSSPGAFLLSKEKVTWGRDLRRFARHLPAACFPLLAWRDEHKVENALKFVVSSDFPRQAMYRRAQFNIFQVAALFLFLEVCPTMFIERISSYYLIVVHEPLTDKLLLVRVHWGRMQRHSSIGSAKINKERSVEQAEKQHHHH